jgi:SPW repeat
VVGAWRTGEFARRALLMATTIERMRETVQWTSGVNVVAGLWLIIAPFVLGYGQIRRRSGRGLPGR